MAKSTGSLGSIGKPETTGKPKPTTPVGKSNRGGGEVNGKPTVPSNPGGGWGHK